MAEPQDNKTRLNVTGAGYSDPSVTNSVLFEFHANGFNTSFSGSLSVSFLQQNATSSILRGEKAAPAPVAAEETASEAEGIAPEIEAEDSAAEPVVTKPVVVEPIAAPVTEADVEEVEADEVPATEKNPILNPILRFNEDDRDAEAEAEAEAEIVPEPVVEAPVEEAPVVEEEPVAEPHLASPAVETPHEAPEPDATVGGGMGGLGGTGIRTREGREAAAFPQENLSVLYAYIKQRKGTLPPHIAAQMALLARINPALYQSLISQDGDMDALNTLQDIADAPSHILSPDGEEPILSIAMPQGEAVLDDTNAAQIMKMIDYNDARNLYKVRYAFPKSKDKIHTEFDPVTNAFHMEAKHDASPQDRIAHAKLILEQLKASGHTMANFKGACDPEFIDAILAAYAQTDGIGIDASSIDRALASDPDLAQDCKTRLAAIDKQKDNAAYKARKAEEAEARKQAVEQRKAEKRAAKEAKKQEQPQKGWSMGETLLALGLFGASVAAISYHYGQESNVVKLDNLGDRYSAFYDYDVAPAAEDYTFENMQLVNQINAAQAWLDGYGVGVGDYIDNIKMDKIAKAQARYDNQIQNESFYTLSDQDLHDYYRNKNGNPFGPEMVDANRAKTQGASSAAQGNTILEQDNTTLKMTPREIEKTITAFEMDGSSTASVAHNNRKEEYVPTPRAAYEETIKQNNKVNGLVNLADKMAEDRAKKQAEIDAEKARIAEQERILKEQKAYQDSVLAVEAKAIENDVRAQIQVNKEHAKFLEEQNKMSEKTINDIKKGKYKPVAENKGDMGVDPLYGEAPQSHKNKNSNKQHLKDRPTLFGPAH